MPGLLHQFGTPVPSLSHRVWHFLLTPDPDEALLYTYVAVMGTLITLLLTVALIPLQQCASQYTPALLRYFRDDKQLQAYRHFLLGVLAAVLLFCLFPARKWSELTATILVAASFVVLVLAVRRSTPMLNPVEFLLPKAREEAKAGLESAFALAAQHTETDWQTAFELGFEVGDYPEYGEKMISTVPWPDAGSGWSRKGPSSWGRERD
jgi:predicted lysophospholipase L1 biosynthesis ABC-type transport system permease subunit